MTFLVASSKGVGAAERNPMVDALIAQLQGPGGPRAEAGTQATHADALGNMRNFKGLEARALKLELKQLTEDAMTAPSNPGQWYAQQAERAARLRRMLQQCNLTRAELVAVARALPAGPERVRTWKRVDDLFAESKRLQAALDRCETGD